MYPYLAVKKHIPESIIYNIYPYCNRIPTSRSANREASQKSVAKSERSSTSIQSENDLETIGSSRKCLKDRNQNNQNYNNLERDPSNINAVQSRQEYRNFTQLKNRAYLMAYLVLLKTKQ